MIRILGLAIAALTVTPALVCQAQTMDETALYLLTGQRVEFDANRTAIFYGSTEIDTEPDASGRIQPFTARYRHIFRALRDCVYYERVERIHPVDRPGPIGNRLVDLNNVVRVSFTQLSATSLPQLHGEGNRVQCVKDNAEPFSDTTQLAEFPTQSCYNEASGSMRVSHESWLRAYAHMRTFCPGRAF